MNLLRKKIFFYFFNLNSLDLLNLFDGYTEALMK